jgi:predicted outer membrane protein
MSEDPNTQPENQQAQGETPASWEEYLATQPESIQGLYTSHSEALVNTVKATRQERDALSKQLKELAKTQAAGSEAQKQLEAMSAQLQEAEQRASFFEDAGSAQCRNTKAAWLLAKAGGHFEKNGRPNWAAIRGEAPELFGPVLTKSNAGTGTQSAAPTGKDMNEFIRKAAGR